MRITVIGAGNAGTTVAADLAHKGHEVKILKSSESTLHSEHYIKIKEDKTITVNDLSEKYTVTLADVTDDFKEALSDAQVIILYVQTNYHKQLVSRMIPYLKKGQTVIIEPGYLSSCYFLNNPECPEITLIEAESSPIDCRIINPGEVAVVFKNVLNPFGVFPKSDEEKAAGILEELQYPFELTKNVVEAALHNPNLIVHTIGAFMSIPRIEYSKGDYWMYREVFTPCVWNIVESLDTEKMDVLEALGCERLPYVEACKKRNSTDKSSDAKEVFFDYAQNGSPRGPFVPDSRYITEDVPQGLVMLESLGKILGIPTPTATALIDLSSVSLCRSFRNEGRTVESLGFENIKRILEEV